VTLAYQKEIVQSWFDRGQRHGESTFDRLIYLWIALNAALSARWPFRGDRKKVELLASELSPHWPRWLQADLELREAAISKSEAQSTRNH
jgi:hypothetical protein